MTHTHRQSGCGRYSPPPSYMSWFIHLTHVYWPYIPIHIYYHDSFIWYIACISEVRLRRVFSASVTDIHSYVTWLIHMTHSHISYILLCIYISFRKSDLYVVALLWKMICNLGDPMSLRHPVPSASPTGTILRDMTHSYTAWRIHARHGAVIRDVTCSSVLSIADRHRNLNGIPLSFDKMHPLRWIYSNSCMVALVSLYLSHRDF